MKRRAFIAGAITLSAAPLAAEAQPAGRVWRIGYLSGGTMASPATAAFREGLRDRGWVEGQNVIVEYGFAGAVEERYPALVAELIGLKVDVIVTTTTTGALAAKRATTEIPIVFTMVSDPVASGLVASLARPGGNATGWSNILPGTTGKLLELLREAVPGASRIAVLANPTNPGKVLEIKALRNHAQTLGLTLHVVEVPTPPTLDAAFSAIVQTRPDALIVLTDAVTWTERQRIAEFAAKHRVPAIYQVRVFTDAGGLMSYGLDVVGMYRRTAIYIDKIFKGAKPADLPVEQPMLFELVINLKAAKALGLKIPPSLLVRADEVLQ